MDSKKINTKRLRRRKEKRAREDRGVVWALFASNSNETGWIKTEPVGNDQGKTFGEVNEGKKVTKAWVKFLWGDNEREG